MGRPIYRMTFTQRYELAKRLGELRPRIEEEHLSAVKIRDLLVMEEGWDARLNAAHVKRTAKEANMKGLFAQGSASAETCAEVHELQRQVQALAGTVRSLCAALDVDSSSLDDILK